MSMAVYFFSGMFAGTFFGILSVIFWRIDNPSEKGKKEDGELKILPGRVYYVKKPIRVIELSFLQKLIRHIEKHYKERVDWLIVELSPRDLYELMCCVGIHNHQFNEFKALESGGISHIWFHGAMLVRENGAYPKIEEEIVR